MDEHHAHREAPASNLSAALARITEAYSPRTVARVNDYEVRVARLQGAFDWHEHTRTDEFFMCLSGEFILQVQLDTGLEEINMGVGDIFVVPSWVSWSLQAETQFDLFRFSDAPIMERLDFMRTQVTGQ